MASTVRRPPAARVLLTAVLALALAALGLVTTPGDARASTGRFVVVYRDGTAARAKATRLGVQPSFVYSSALSGFAAPLTLRQRRAALRDPATLMVVPVGAAGVQFDPGPLLARTARAPQVVPNGVRRIGGLASPTAAIDGHDTAVDADVAVIDTGVTAQADLDVVGGTSCTGGSGFGDVMGHGTLVASVIAARDNGFGVVGVAPGARIWSVRAFDSHGSGNVTNVLCALDWVMAHHRVVDVVNMSFEDFGTDDGHCGLTAHDPMHWALCHVVDKGGVTAVAAAGNDAGSAARHVPSAYSQSISVSALADSDGRPGGHGGRTCRGDYDDTFAPFSNFGRAVDLAAPGECIVGLTPNGGLTVDSGTSFSAPHVSGAAALYLARHPAAGPSQVRTALRGHRERVSLRGDHDGIAEGVVDVRGW